MSQELKNLAFLRAEFDEKVATLQSVKEVVDNLEPVIDDADVAAVVARRTGIPVTKMLTAEIEAELQEPGLVVPPTQQLSDVLQQLENATMPKRLNYRARRSCRASTNPQTGLESMAKYLDAARLSSS